MFPAWLMGQNSATASFTASVTVIEPIEVKTTSHMNFANIDAREGGTVILHPDNTREAIGSVNLESNSEVSAAVFEVNGQNGYSYDIALPESSYILTNGSENITIKDFQSDFSSGNFSGSSQNVRVGASIYINPDQEPGVYTSQTLLQVTVNYN
ncbi:uncharacterized protein DUF4402 [Christiangramia gaetbulicola]|uniref:Uncharacterized protein DUF4402 n=2 Tax=Christiangramia gaetbulicola TaxID=703340 RepID=A0A2T6AH53_9FLAO|nr:uncharacterized protein DUF4402 [Christiangramia gaetbulicola]